MTQGVAAHEPAHFPDFSVAGGETTGIKRAHEPATYKNRKWPVLGRQHWAGFGWLYSNEHKQLSNAGNAAAGWKKVSGATS